MRIAQDGRCAICGDLPKRLCIDHDHKTGRVRGLLCIQCNARLAYVEDPDWMAAATRYLRLPVQE